MSTTASGAGSVRELPVGDLIDQLMQHPLYARLRGEAELRIFLRTHVFCVWDFQSLLKALQRQLTCVTLPWLPTPDPEARRLINELVLDEESDIAPDGGHLSHFELYLAGMRQSGADDTPVLALLNGLREGQSLERVLAALAGPPGVADFVRCTFALAGDPAPHRVAAAFTYGREQVIPGMFTALVRQLADVAPQRWSTIRYYLERHIGRDDEVHGPAARRLVARLCGQDERRWSEAEAAARTALTARLTLWDALDAQLQALTPASRAAPPTRAANEDSALETAT
ncbi:MAG: DUF3050 domain-containing protein [Planctomycetota bacterium]